MTNFERADLSKIILFDFLCSLSLGFSILFIFLALSRNSNFYWGTAFFCIIAFTLSERRFNFPQSFINSDLDLTGCFSLDSIENWLGSVLFLILTLLTPLDFLYRVAIYTSQRFI